MEHTFTDWPNWNSLGIAIGMVVVYFIWIRKRRED